MEECEREKNISKKLNRGDKRSPLVQIEDSKITKRMKANKKISMADESIEEETSERATIVLKSH